MIQLLKVKRLILAISSLFYLSTAIGANIHFHYCMGELAGWEVGHSRDKECNKCGMETNAAKDSGCCKDEFKHIKLAVDQKSPDIAIYQFHLVESGSLQPGMVSLIYWELQPIYSSLAAPPPLRTSCIATYLRNCNFRI